VTRPSRRLAAGLLVAALLATGTALAAQAAGFLDAGEHRTIATRFGLRAPAPPDDVVLVAIDDATFADLQRQWPFPRSLHGRLIDALRRARAREIVYDVQFTEPTRPAQDLALYAALRRAGGAVLATSEFDDQGHTNVLGGDDNLAAVRSRAGAANLVEGPEGVLDRFPFASGALKSLAIVAAERAGGPRLPRSAFAGRGAWIDFRGPPGTIRTVSFSSVLDGRVDPAVFRGRIVVVGATAPSLQDLHATPTSSEPMSGPEIQANALWTALHGLPLRDAALWLNLGLVVLLGVAIPLVRLRLPVLATAGVALGLAAVYLVAAQALFAHGTVVWVVAPLLALTIGTVAMIVASHLAETAVRRRVARENDELEGRVRERTAELRRTQLEILHRLSRAAEWRDEDTGRHVERMGDLGERLGLALGLSPEHAETLRHAAVAHDIGKIAVPDRVLLKPQRLSPAERQQMERHALIGASMLSGSESEVMQLAETIARTHHERWDGAGYPDGLSGEDIPLAGRICAVCDVFDALVSERPYKRAWSVDEALDEIAAQRGRHFDPAVVDAFLPIARRAYAELYGDDRSAARGAAATAAADPPALSRAS
jgi:response regulator RpfG family c-di-GMP phosphodiesterase